MTPSTSSAIRTEPNARTEPATFVPALDNLEVLR